MDLLDSFLGRYVKEYDYYEQVARTAAQTLDTALRTAGIRAIVTSRAKSVTRLESKCRQRHSKQPYGSIDDIYADIVDLAGIRVALYFPGEREQVGNLISRLFVEYEPRRVFPSGAVEQRQSRFSGYSALHYRVRLRPTDLSESDRRYASANIEIQVASVLMHAWAEVEHDLVYKPYEGELSDEEYSLLDQLNGLVLAGEISLEQLQRAGDVRIAVGSRRFANHYELAAHLLSQMASVNEKPISEAGLGRVDLLFDLLTRLQLDTPDDLRRYLDIVHDDLELRPLAEQIIDALLAEDQSRYDVYRTVRSDAEVSQSDSAPIDSSVYGGTGHFLMQWARLERLLRDIAPNTLPTNRAIDQLTLMDPELRYELNQLRRLRNAVVHGLESPPSASLRDAGDRLDVLIREIERSYTGGEEGDQRLRS